MANYSRDLVVVSRAVVTAIAALVFVVSCGGGSGAPVLSTPPPPPLAADEVRTNDGVLRGSIEGDLRVFRGIPYAAPPVGEMRFRRADPSPNFSTTRDAIEFGDVCIQPAGGGVVGSEDCLFLNIWSHNDSLTRPTLVFLHGGAANGAGGSSAVIDGAILAETADMIVVTVNRRFGALGYLAIDELVADSSNDWAGNYATHDVQMALEWLIPNIEEFGGDRQQIMLAGQSAGGAVVCDLLSSPMTNGLINSAALHSAGCRGNLPVLNDQVGVPTDEEFASVTHRELVEFFGCDVAADVLACLRALPAVDIVLAEENLDVDFSGVIDGVVITDIVGNALRDNVAGDIPLIIGSTEDETRNIFTANPVVADDAAYQQLLFVIFDAPLDGALYALYPTADYASANDAFHTMFGDLLFNCRAEVLANAAADNAPVFMFNFARGFDNGSLAGLGATHTIDVAHLFGSFAIWGYTPDQQALDLATAMRSAWRSMAADPMMPPPYLPMGASAWPVYTEAAQQIVTFGDTITIASEHRGGRCPALLALF